MANNDSARLTAIEYSNNYWSAIELSNQSANDEVTVELDCTKCENCLGCPKELFNSVRLKPGKSKIVMFLTAKIGSKDWTTKCNIKVISNANA